MGLQKRFGEGLRRARKSKNLTQEDFSLVSSRTYLSTLERGLKSPTIEKLEQIAAVLEVHPLTLLAMAYLPKKSKNPDSLFERIAREIQAIE